MGIHDREYYRDDKSYGVHFASQWSMVTRLIAINVAVFVVNFFLGNWLDDKLSASPDSLTNPLLCWQLLTYAFAHDPQNLSHIFWNMFGLWVFGRDVESTYGRKEFLRIYLVAAVLGGLVFALRGYVVVHSEQFEGYWPTVHGASGAVMAITLLFCLHFPKRIILLMLVFPVPAWVVGMMVIAGNLFGVANPHGNVAHDVHLVGLILAGCYFYGRWNFGRWLPSVRLPSVKMSTSWFKSKPKLRLHDPKRHSADFDSKADALLDKVNREGMDSLNAREKRMLEEYSRRMRQKHQ